VYSSCGRFAVPNSHFVSGEVRSTTLTSAATSGSELFPSDRFSVRDNRGCDRALERTCDGPASPGDTPIENVATGRSGFSFIGWLSIIADCASERGCGGGLGLLHPPGAPTLPNIISRLPGVDSSQPDPASNMGFTTRYPATASDSCGGGGRAIIVGGGKAGWIAGSSSPDGAPSSSDT